MNANTALIAAGIIFSIVALLHLWRLYFKIDVIIAGKTIPMQASIIGLIVSLLLALWMFISIQS